MARLVVRNRDKVNPDSPYLDAKCMKRGMVVDILEDGQSLGVEGDRYTGWTVVDLPGVLRDDLTAFLAPEPGDPLQDRMLQRRAFKVNLDALVSMRGRLRLQDVLALKVVVAKRSDTNIL